MDLIGVYWGFICIMALTFRMNCAEVGFWSDSFDN